MISEKTSRRETNAAKNAPGVLVLVYFPRQNGYGACLLHASGMHAGHGKRINRQALCPPERGLTPWFAQVACLVKLFSSQHKACPAVSPAAVSIEAA
jgi:hypothetical protein